MNTLTNNTLIEAIQKAKEQLQKQPTRYKMIVPSFLYHGPLKPMGCRKWSELAEYYRNIKRSKDFRKIVDSYLTPNL